jgi:hypothetical protein
MWLLSGRSPGLACRHARQTLALSRQTVTSARPAHGQTARHEPIPSSRRFLSGRLPSPREAGRYVIAVTLHARALRRTRGRTASSAVLYFCRGKLGKLNHFVLEGSVRRLLPHSRQAARGRHFAGKRVSTGFVRGVASGTAELTAGTSRRCDTAQRPRLFLEA